MAAAQSGQISAQSRLVEPWQTHLKFNGREPRNLLELGIAQADYEHRHRLGELKGLTKKLEQLDALRPALAAQGIKLQGRDFKSHDSGKTVWLSCYTHPDDKLHQALLGLGFREIARAEAYKGSRTDNVQLKLGRSLVLRLEVSKLPAPVPAAAHDGVPA